VGALEKDIQQPEARADRIGCEIRRHEGFDWEGIQKAYEKNRKKGRSSPALDDQPAARENLFLSTKRTPLAQGRGSRHHADAGALMDKRRIFEILPERDRMGQRRVRRRGCRAPTTTAPAPLACPTEQAAKLAAMCPTRATTTSTARRAG